MSEEKTVCIVGVAGFIGSHLLEKIIRERTWNVLGCDMVSPLKIQQLLGAEKKWAGRFSFTQMDIVKEPAKLKELIKQSDVVINLAAICNPSEYIKQPMYSEITGKPKGTTRTVSGVEYYGPGYEDSDLRIPSMRLIEQQLGWTPPTSLKSAMEATMKVFIEKYADKVQALKRTSDEAEPAAKKAKA